jgi:hypothetical protein
MRKFITIVESLSEWPQTISGDELSDYAEEWHHREEDWETGNLLNRITSFKRYALETLNLDSLNAHEWDVHDDLVNHYAGLASNAPPIIYDDVNKSIIDGTHRVNAALARGETTVPAYVGRLADYQPVYDEDDEWHPDPEEHGFSRVDELQQATAFNVDTITATKADNFDRMTGGGGGQKPPMPPRRRDERPERGGPTFVIPAQVHDDFWHKKVTFEALDWFEQATDEDLAALIAIDFRGDYASDWVAEWTAEKNAEVEGVLDYARDTKTGFECVVSPDAAYVWLAHYRPHLVDPDFDGYSG